MYNYIKILIRPNTNTTLRTPGPPVIIDGKYGTCNNKMSIRLPKVRLESAKNGFYFLGGKIYNELPVDIRKAETLNDFNVRLQAFLNIS